VVRPVAPGGKRRRGLAHPPLGIGDRERAFDRGNRRLPDRAANRSRWSRREKSRNGSLKDARAMLDPSYVIDSNLTADMGRAFLATLTNDRAKLVTDQVAAQKPLLYSIVDRRMDMLETAVKDWYRAAAIGTLQAGRIC
jgi:hypothetical protein